MQKNWFSSFGGNTGLAGGTYAEGALELSLERLNTIREMRKSSCIAAVESGVVLTSLHHAVDAYDLIFPMNFGAKGSTKLGGMLSTNAGGQMYCTTETHVIYALE